MTIQQIHKALSQGKKVYWGNSNYQVFQKDIRVGTKFEEHDLNHETTYNGKMLTIIHVPNWWGGLAELSELKDCYTV